MYQVELVAGNKSIATLITQQMYQTPPNLLGITAVTTVQHCVHVTMVLALMNLFGQHQSSPVLKQGLP